MAVSKDEILETIANMSVMDVVGLIEAMEEKFNVSAATAVAAVAAPAAAAAGRRHRLPRFLSRPAARRTLQAGADRSADHGRSPRRCDPPAAGRAAAADRQGTGHAAAPVRR